MNRHTYFTNGPIEYRTESAGVVHLVYVPRYNKPEFIAGGIIAAHDGYPAYNNTQQYLGTFPTFGDAVTAVLKNFA